MTVPEYVELLLGWYEAEARRFLVQHVPDRVEALDADLSRLATLRDLSREELPVCFLGNSGVGKSTLLNAMVAGDLTVLPQGGVGPLTAQATVVRHSPERFFRATYLPRRRVNELLFALERHHEALIKDAGGTVESRSAELTSGLGEDERQELEAGLPTMPEADTPADDKIEGLKRQAQLLVLGNQFASGELPYVLDALRRTIGSQPRWGTQLRPEDQVRVESLQAVLERAGTPYERRAGDDVPGFLEDLYCHAAGFLSPLIKTLEVGWDADFLQGGLVLVDLPGLGVANDEYRRVTTDWIRRARAVVLVVDRSGFTDASADLLRSTGFLNSLMHESHDLQQLPVHLLVAVTKLDQSAEDARVLERQTRPPPHRKWIDHFEDACSSAISVLKEQVREQLSAIAESGPEKTRTERRNTVQRVRDSLEVHPVAAREFRRFAMQDDEDRPRITSPDQSRVPQLVEALRRVSAEHTGRLEDRLLRSAADFQTRLANLVGLLNAQWQEDTRADEEARKLQEDLDQFLAPLRSQLLVRQGAFREFLRSGLPTQIEARIDEASLTAKEDIAKYLRKLETYHWGTLRAAVRRGGTYVGAKHVDLPNELTLRFEEPVAVVWSKHILAALRKRTRELGDDYVQLVGEVVAWAKSQGTRVQPKLVEALHEDLKGEVRGLSSVGQEAIDELRERVKAQLFDRVNERVRRKCLDFVDSKRDVGPGLKRRLIHFFHEDLVEAVVDGAKPAARRVLTSNYEGVAKDVSTLFDRLKNPLDRAASEIVDQERARLRRSDAQRRRHVLEEAQRVLAAQPPLPGAPPAPPPRPALAGAGA